MGFVVKEAPWQGRIVPFEIDPAIGAFYSSTAFRQANPGVVVESTRLINEAVAAWNDRAVIRLRPRASESHYLKFKRGARGAGGHAFSATRGEASITFDFEWGLNGQWNVAVTAMMHEIGHTVGLIHEHQRPDRNNFITFNVPTDSNGDLKMITDQRMVRTYDCLSIMHYKPVGNPPNFVTKPGGCSSFGRLDDPRLSDGDVAALEALYPSALVVSFSPAGVGGRAANYQFRVARADNGRPVGGAKLTLTNGTSAGLPQSTAFNVDDQGMATRTLTLRPIRRRTGSGLIEAVAPSVIASKQAFTSSAVTYLLDL